MPLPLLKECERTVERDVFRLENHRVYNVEGDRELYERFLSGESVAVDDPDSPYLSKLARSRERGILRRRVRTVDFPIHDYLRYEIESYKLSNKYGEDVLFAERAIVVDCMQSTVVTNDYWLFDDKIVLLFHYTKDGRWLGEELVETESAVQPYLLLKQCLLEHALPMDTFLSEFAITD